MSEHHTMTSPGRQSGRVRLAVRCEIKTPKETIQVPVGDISLDGCRLHSSKEHAAGETLQLALQLPARIELAAEVRWVKADADGKRHILGCKFTHSGDSRKTLKDAMQNMASAIDTAARRVK
jgi:hypothetical protein